MRERNKGFNMRCSPEFLEAMARAAGATGMTKTQIVEAAVAKILPEYFATSIRAVSTKNEVQNTHIEPVLEPDLEAKRQVRRKNRPR